MNTAQLWPEQCEAAAGIRKQYGLDQAIGYLVGEKFANFVEAAREEPALQSQLPEFAARIKGVFTAQELAAWFEHARKVRSDMDLNDLYDEFDDPEERRWEAERGLRRMYKLEDAAKWLL